MVDFDKLIELLLPTFLRKERVLNLLRVLIVEQVKKMSNEFQLWKFNADYDAAVTSQVCSLEAAIARNFDVTAYIKELDGRPYDFIVEFDRPADLSKISEFINRHKLAGKSFLFQTGESAYTARWVNYVYENIITAYTGKWIDYVNEDDCVIVVKAYLYQEIDYVNSTFQTVLSLASERKMPAEVEFDFLLFKTDNFRDVSLWKIETMGIRAGYDNVHRRLQYGMEGFDRSLWAVEKRFVSDKYAVALKIIDLDFNVIKNSN